MAKVLRRRWPGKPDRALPRRDRRGCEYEAYIPDPLVGRHIQVDGDVAADVADAEAAIRELSSTAVVLVDTEALARLLLRAESVASSYIEGLVVGGRRLLQAEAERTMGHAPTDATAAAVLGNIDAMAWAIAGLATASTVTADGILEVHRRLLAGTPLSDCAGRLRTQQNWIGGSGFNPCAAAFVPPPHEYIGELVADLCAFVDDDSLPPLVQAALAHAQFETIYPFIDGNGRTGRTLIHVILRRRGLAPQVLPPISLVLATWSESYLAGLTATRYRGAPGSRAAHDGINRWIATFAAACRRAAEDATSFESRVADIEQQWRRALGRVRASSAAERLLAVLPGAPILSVSTAAELVGRSYQATNEAMRRLAAAGVVRQVNVGRRNRAYEAKAVIDAFTALERQLASPVGDTRTAGPRRPVPAPVR